MHLLNPVVIAAQYSRGIHKLAAGHFKFDCDLVTAWTLEQHWPSSSKCAEIGQTCQPTIVIALDVVLVPVPQHDSVQNNPHSQ